MQHRNFNNSYSLQSEGQYQLYYHSYFYNDNKLCYNYLPFQYQQQNTYLPNFKSFIEEIKKKQQGARQQKAETKLNKVKQEEVEEKAKEIVNAPCRKAEKLRKVDLKIKYFDINVAPTITSDNYAMVQQKQKEIARKVLLKKLKKMKINQIDYPEEDSNPFIIFKDRRIKKKFKKYLKDEENYLCSDKNSSVERQLAKIQHQNVDAVEEKPLKIEIKNEDLFIVRESARDSKKEIENQE